MLHYLGANLRGFGSDPWYAIETWLGGSMIGEKSPFGQDIIQCRTLFQCLFMATRFKSAFDRGFGGFRVLGIPLVLKNIRIGDVFRKFNCV